MDKNKTNKLLLNVRLLLFESKKNMSFPVAHLYKQFFGQANTEMCTTLQSNTKEKLVLRLCANFTTCLPAVYYYNVFVTKKYPIPPYTLHTFKTHTEEEN